MLFGSFNGNWNISIIEGKNMCKIRKVVLNSVQKGRFDDELVFV